MGRKAKTHAQFVAELAEVSPDITILGEYVVAKTKVLVKHTCDHEWSATANSLLAGHSCPKCGGSEKKTHEQFVTELAEVSPDITVLREYVSAWTKLLVQHNCGHRWSTTPNSLLAGHSCPKCGGRENKTHEQFVVEIAEVSPDITVLGEYTNNRTKLNVQHTCGHRWSVRPNDVLQGYGCPKCGGTEKKTHQQFVTELAEVNPDITVLGEYVGSNTKLQVQHTCGHRWGVTPSDLLKGRGCPKCAKSGYKPDKTGFFYSYYFDGYLGFGITNNHECRHNQHLTTFKKLGIEATLMQTFSGDGKAIQDLESHLKRTLPIVNTGVEGFKTEAILWGDRELLFKACEEFQRSQECVKKSGDGT